METPQSPTPATPGSSWGGTPSSPAGPPPTQWQAPEPTPGPAPGYEFGGPGERLLAYILDGLVNFGLIILIGIVGGLVIGAGAAAGSGLLAGTGILLTLAAIIIVPLAYFPWFWSRGGQTPGMRVFNLRVVRDADGGPVSGGAAILRLIGYWVSGAVFYLGYVWIFIDKRKRGWHDLIAGTVVVKAR